MRPCDGAAPGPDGEQALAGLRELLWRERVELGAPVRFVDADRWGGARGGWRLHEAGGRAAPGGH